MSGNGTCIEGLVLFQVDYIPPPCKSGDQLFVVPLRDAKSRAEHAMIAAFLSNLPRFGSVYSELRPEYFWQMQEESGVLVSPLVDFKEVCTTEQGDIDLLIVPYIGSALDIENTTAVEVKTVRGSFKKPGKPPNSKGVKQAAKLLNLGFPFVAVIHFITSDRGPESSWRSFMNGRAGPDDQLLDRKTVRADGLFSDITTRCYGRLKAALKDTPEIGFSCIHMAYDDETLFKHQGVIHFPESEKCLRSKKVSEELFEKILTFYLSNSDRFINIRR